MFLLFLTVTIITSMYTCVNPFIYTYMYIWGQNGVVRNRSKGCVFRGVGVEMECGD